MPAVHQATFLLGNPVILDIINMFILNDEFYKKHSMINESGNPYFNLCKLTLFNFMKMPFKYCLLNKSFTGINVIISMKYMGHRDFFSGWKNS